MRKTTVLIYLDACRFDYITKENTPFLYEIAQNGIFKRIRTTPGFTQRTAILTGAYPVESNHFTWYRYDPSNSLFKWVKPFKALKDIPKSIFYPPVKVGIRIITKFITGTLYPYPAHIPLDLLPYFDIVDSKVPLEYELAHLPNILSMCLSSGYSYLNLMFNYSFIYSKRYEEIFGNAYKSIKKGEKYDLYLMHIAELDNLGHRYGPKIDFLRKYLGGIDSYVEKLSRLLQKHYGNYNLIAVSDHGMRDVIGFVDVWDRLERLELKLHKDYIFFLDSTIARFWFKNDRARKEVTEMLLDLPHGHIISDVEKIQLGIDFKHDMYGDLLFWADNGYIIFPNFFDPRNIPKGMHGYPNDEDGVLIVRSDEKIVDLENVVPLVHTFQILVKLLHLNSCEASTKSLVKRI